MVEDVVPDELDVSQLIDPGVFACQGQGRLRDVHAQHGRRPGTGRVQTETAGVAEGVKHTPARGQTGDRLAVVALVEVKPRLLALRQIDQERQASIFNADRFGGHVAPEGPIVRFQTFQLADAALGALINALRPEQLNKQVHEQVAPLGQTQGGQLQDQPAVVAVHDTAGQAVPLAED